MRIGTDVPGPLHYTHVGDKVRRVAAFVRRQCAAARGGRLQQHHVARGIPLGVVARGPHIGVDDEPVAILGQHARLIREKCRAVVRLPRERASGSVTERRVAFECFSPRKFTLGLLGSSSDGGGGSSIG